eukprot:2012081-Prymnesium_polylepis.1
MLPGKYPRAPGKVPPGTRELTRDGVSTVNKPRCPESTPHTCLCQSSYWHCGRQVCPSTRTEANVDPL